MIPENIEPYFVLGVIALLFVSVYKDIVRPSVSFLIAMIIFMLSGILEYQDILDGLSNDKIASIILLVLITGGLRKNFNLELIFDTVFRTAKSYQAFLLRMMSQVALLSSGINNTPVVALMTPYVFNWGKNNNISPSKLLIPLSFATIMGGMITVIGTSTTLLLNGFLGDSGEALVQPLDLLIIGSAVTVTGIIFIILIGHKLLPNKIDLIDKFNQNIREYVIETQLTENSDYIGKTVAEGNLRNLNGAYLVEIDRETSVISPVEPNELILPNDKLIFAGDTSTIIKLAKEKKNLKLPKQVQHYDGQDDLNIIETVISGASSLIGKTIKETGFRNRYDAAIVAIHRGGQKVSGRIGDIQIQAGDLFLLYAGKDFKERADLYRDLIVVSSMRNEVPASSKKYVAIAVALITIFAAGYLIDLSLFPALLIIFGIFVAFEMISLQDMKRELDLNMVAILVFSLGLGKAIINTRAGDLIADNVISLMEPYGLVAILIGLVLISNLLTSIIGNVGAVSIAFPIAYALGNNLGIDAMPLYLGIAFGASATFMTPISYQTNLIIYGPGGYNFYDFFKIGLPVTILYLGVSICCIVYLYSHILLR